MCRVVNGIYEVLEYETSLELLDASSKKANYDKRQRVRFLQDNEDQAWGDGQIFADYKCSPGIAVDRYQDGNRYRILISLRETKKYGTIEKFHIHRRIENGCTKKSEYFQPRIDQPDRNYLSSIICTGSGEGHGSCRELTPVCLLIH